MSSFGIAISSYKFVFCIYFFVFQKLEKIGSRRDSDTGTFLWISQNFANFFIEHLRNAPSKTVAEDKLGNSARNGKLHIISPVYVWLGSFILENKMKNVENKAMLKC